MKKYIVTLLIVMCLMVYGCGETTPAVSSEVPEGVSSLKKGIATTIEYKKVFNAKLGSFEEARDAIAEYGERQRENYHNEKVTKLEKKLEKKYSIPAVNLGEIDYATARDIQKAFKYMFKNYPQIKGTLTNLTLANIDGSPIALTETREFIIDEDYGVPPFVVKYQIVLNAAKFLQRDKLLATCDEMVEAGHWPEGTNITSLVVHELGHQVLDVIAMKEYGLIDENGVFNGLYITKENHDSYSLYITDSLSANQKIPQKILAESYECWQQEYGQTGTEEEFRNSISQYAGGVQQDGGISYTETVAEAVADVYLQGRKATEASKAIVEVLKRHL